MKSLQQIVEDKALAHAKLVLASPNTGSGYEIVNRTALEVLVGVAEKYRRLIEDLKSDIDFWSSACHLYIDCEEILEQKKNLLKEVRG